MKILVAIKRVQDYNIKVRPKSDGSDVDLEGVKKDDSGPTFFWKGKYHENFNRRDTLDIRLNVFEKFRPDLPESYKDSSFVLLGNIHPALQMHVLDQLAGNSFVLADTIDLWIETERESLLSLIKKVSLFVINDKTPGLSITSNLRYNEFV